MTYDDIQNDLANLMKFLRGLMKDISSGQIQHYPNVLNVLLKLGDIIRSLKGMPNIISNDIIRIRIDDIDTRKEKLQTIVSDIVENNLANSKRVTITNYLSDLIRYCDALSNDLANLPASGNAGESNGKAENLAETEQEIIFQKTDDGRWMVQQAEGQTLEFKETLMYSIHTEQKDEGVLKESLKTIVGFLNAKGGTLLIGVSDDGNIKGLKEDFEFVHKKNQDGFQLRLRDSIKNQFDPEPVGQVNITFKEFNGKVICQVEVKACKEITHLDKETYVRDGNRTPKLEGRSLIDWARRRPPR